jgi:hypothetical protein
VATGTSNGKPQRGPPYSVYGFPEIISIYAATRRRSVEIYTRGLLLEGHGYPVFYPYGILDPEDNSILKPITVGDVGVIGADGHMDWLFNIFLPADRPTQIYLPREFQPFDPAPDESDILFTSNYHAPGTIITSPGVNVDVRSKSPGTNSLIDGLTSLTSAIRDVTFTSTENQAAMLILQGCADRYDLKSTNRYHEYIAKHAQHWYQVANHYGEATYPNGSLLVVTGYDSCQRFSHAQFAPESMHLTMHMRFKQDLGDMPGHWISKGHNHTVGWPYPEGSNMKALDAPLTVFVRGLRISLNGSTWRSILPSTGFLPRNKHCTLVANKASKKQLWLEKTMGRLGIGLTEEETLQDVFSVHEVSSTLAFSPAESEQVYSLHSSPIIFWGKYFWARYSFLSIT